MATQKLQVKQTIVDSIQYGIKNVGSLILMIILYVVTVWIPYLNVGTTIGLYKAIIDIGKGKVINPVSIFAKENRKDLGDFFLLMGFITIGTTAAAMFAIIPAFVVSIAWSYALLFFIDRKLSPTKCLNLSWKVTDGEKWTIFWIYFIVIICFSLIGGLFALIPKVGWIFSLIVYILLAAVAVALEGVMFAHFSAKADEIQAEKLAAKAAACACPAPEAPAATEEPAAAAAPEAPAEEAPAEPEKPAE